MSRALVEISVIAPHREFSGRHENHAGWRSGRELGAERLRQNESEQQRRGDERDDKPNRWHRFAKPGLRLLTRLDVGIVLFRGPGWVYGPIR
jgi:hypothetical protein